ncbi:hypothetical protein [Microbacterium sp. NPDC079995]|uniref:hypothetical protein n=1 Tax=unclassified Microbacterium TaxID=2609290 RepID=UPI00344C9B86
MSEKQGDQQASPRSEELGLLLGITAVAFIVGLILLLLGLIDASPGWDDSPDEGPRRASHVLWGAAVMALGFISLVGALVLSAVRRMLAGDFRSPSAERPEARPVASLGDQES